MKERKNYTITLFLDNGHGCGANIQKYVVRGGLIYGNF